MRTREEHGSCWPPGSRLPARLAAMAGSAGVLAASLLAGGTSPASAATLSGYQVAFQANTGNLFSYDLASNGHTNANLGMMAGTSPAIAATAAGGYEVAFQANTGLLYMYNPVTKSSVNTHLGMMAGTSPAIAASAAGGYEVAFQANSGHLYTYDPGNNSSADTNLGMAAKTSPAIASNGTGYQVAFQAASTGHLYTYNLGNNSSADTNLGMAAGTSPAIASDGSGYEVAFQAASTGHLYTYDPGNNSSADANLGTAAGTSPAIAAAPPPPPPSNCAAAETCTPQTFADALLGYIGAPVTAANEFSVVEWAATEDVAAACADQTVNASTWPAAQTNPNNTAAGNPLATEQTEPGSYRQPGNTANVQEYVTGSGKTCWQWGVVATSETLQNGNYPNILSVLDNPVSDSRTQCDDLANAVASSPWGTVNFTVNC